MFGASRVEDLIGTPLAHYLSSPKQHEAGVLSTDGLRFAPPVSLCELSFGTPVRHIAVVGAGYVGRSLLCFLLYRAVSINHTDAD
jgi:UDPglucose 6-dehydrogenase